MPRYSLRTLLILLAIGPPLGAWFLFLGWVFCCGTSVWCVIGLIETAVLGLFVAGILVSIWLAISLIVRERQMKENELKHRPAESDFLIDDDGWPISK